MALAADESLLINGSLDMNYIYNFNQPRPVNAPTDTTPAPPAGNNRYRVFDIYHDDFNLALAEITLSKTRGDTKAFVALDFGHTANILSPHDDVSRYVSQATITYTPHEHSEFSFTAGKMLTHFGLEYMKTKNDWNYSRSFLFGYAIPFWHTGLAAHYTANENLSAALFLYNADAGLYQTTRSKSVGAQIQGRPMDKLNLYYNFMNGVENGDDGVTRARTLHEAVATYELRADLLFAADLVFGQLTHAHLTGTTAQWLAWSAAFKYFKGRWSLSPRFEVYTDRSGASVEGISAIRPSVPQALTSATLTLGLDCGDGLELRFEARQDHSSAPSFLTASDTAMSVNQTTLGVGILYDF